MIYLALRLLVTAVYLPAFGLAVVAQMTGPERSWAILALDDELWHLDAADLAAPAVSAAQAIKKKPRQTGGTGRGFGSLRGDL